MNTLRFVMVFLIGFAVYFWIDATFFSTLQKQITSATGTKAVGYFFAYVITLVPLLMTVAVLHRNYRALLERIGLSRGILTGILFAFLVTLPMLIAYGARFDVNTKLSVNTVFINTIIAALFEEIIYRAFLFGQLYRYTRLGFLPAVFLGSLLFGIAHLYQSTDPGELVGIFAITFLGSLLFAWIYAEWKFNLWTAIFLHCLMNLYWLIFDVDENALGGTYANIFRFATVFVAIAGTILYKKRNKIPFEIRGKRWWYKAQAKS